MMNYIFQWYQKVLTWSRHPKAPWYLGFVSFVDASFFPISPAFMLIPMALAAPKKAFYFAFIATLASTLGGVLGYALGMWAFQPLIAPLFEALGYTDTYLQAIRFFEQWGHWAVFFAAFTPIPYKLFTIGAGVMGLNLPLFLLASFGGRGGRFVIMAGLIRFGGPRVENWCRNYLAKHASSMRNN